MSAENNEVEVSVISNSVEENKNEVADEENQISEDTSDSVSVVVEEVTEKFCLRKEIALYGCIGVTLVTVLTSVSYYFIHYYNHDHHD